MQFDQIDLYDLRICGMTANEANPHYESVSFVEFILIRRIRFLSKRAIIYPFQKVKGKSSQIYLTRHPENEDNLPLPLFSKEGWLHLEIISWEYWKDAADAGVKRCFLNRKWESLKATAAGSSRLGLHRLLRDPH